MFSGLVAKVRCWQNLFKPCYVSLGDTFKFGIYKPSNLNVQKRLIFPYTAHDGGGEQCQTIRKAK